MKSIFSAFIHLFAGNLAADGEPEPPDYSWGKIALFYGGLLGLIVFFGLLKLSGAF
jgi:hypothetical protein